MTCSKRIKIFSSFTKWDFIRPTTIVQAMKKSSSFQKQTWQISNDPLSSSVRYPQHVHAYFCLFILFPLLSNMINSFYFLWMILTLNKNQPLSSRHKSGLDAKNSISTGISISKLESCKSLKLKQPFEFVTTFSLILQTSWFNFWQSKILTLLMQQSYNARV